MIALLQQAVSVSITSDSWTNANLLKFVGITAHFLDADFKLFRILLAVTTFPEELTGEALANFYRERIEAEVPDKCLVAAIVTDNGSNFVKAAHDFLGDDACSCFAHTLQLAIHDTMSAAEWHTTVAADTGCPNAMELDFLHVGAIRSSLSVRTPAAS